MMSILIKGMNMPEHGCTDCDLFHNNYGYYFCPIIGEDVRQNVESGNRHINCLLVEIPTPHGDLIDREEHKRFLENKIGRCLELQDHIAWLNEQPTVIESEE